MIASLRIKPWWIILDTPNMIYIGMNRQKNNGSSGTGFAFVAV